MDVCDSIAFAAMTMKRIDDSQHQRMAFNVGDTVNLRLHRGYRLPAIQNRNLGQQFVGPLKIK